MNKIQRRLQPMAFSMEDRRRHLSRLITPASTDEDNNLLDKAIARKRSIMRGLPLFQLALEGGSMIKPFGKKNKHARTESSME